MRRTIALLLLAVGAVLAADAALPPGRAYSFGSNVYGRAGRSAGVGENVAIGEMEVRGQRGVGAHSHA